MTKLDLAKFKNDVVKEVLQYLERKEMATQAPARELLTASEAAAFLGRSITSIYYYKSSGILNPIIKGGTYLFMRSQLQAIKDEPRTKSIKKGVCNG